uniref:Uncharacterized protein n=1 Tax=Anguilla anguilla TaxID=7936 RepID=A0A0E9WD88_ANGAN
MPILITYKNNEAIMDAPCQSPLMYSRLRLGHLALHTIQYFHRAFKSIYFCFVLSFIHLDEVICHCPDLGHN